MEAVLGKILINNAMLLPKQCSSFPVNVHFQAKSDIQLSTVKSVDIDDIVACTVSEVAII